MTRHVAVLMGGLSAEREVSLVSGEACAKALEEQGYPVTRIDVGRDLHEVLARTRPDVVFNALHGRFGEDGRVQGVLDQLGLPYTHSGVLASALAMDKPMAKRVFASAGLRCPEGVETTLEQLLADPPLAPPFVVKPAAEGSSVGVVIVPDHDLRPLTDRNDVDPACRLLVERYVAGRELTCAVLGDEPLAVTEIRPNDGFYDYRAKYTEGFASHLVPAPLSPDLYEAGDGVGAACPPGAGLPGRQPCRLPARPEPGRWRAVPPGGQHPAGHDALVAGARAGRLLRHRFRRACRPPPGAGAMRQIKRLARPGAAQEQPAPAATAALGGAPAARRPGRAGAGAGRRRRLRLPALERRRTLGRAISGARLVAASVEAGFVVERVYSEGRSLADEATLKRTLEPHHNRPIFTVELEKLKQQVEALPWVRSASVGRRLPDTIWVRLDEHRPIARWMDGTRQVLVSDAQEVFKVKNAARYRELPLLFGKGAPARSVELLAAGGQ